MLFLARLKLYKTLVKSHQTNLIQGVQQWAT